MKDFYKKESPLQGISGLAGGATGLRMAGGISEGGPYTITGGNVTTPGNGYKYFDFKVDTPAPTANLNITVDGSPDNQTFPPAE